MATSASSASTLLWHERRERVRDRLKGVPKRSLAVAADEFFADDDWRTLPQRLQRLCQVLLEGNDDAAADASSALTACILVSAPASFETQLESLCRSSLAQRMQDDTVAEQQRGTRKASNICR
jgi:hypothetical protein